MRTGRRIAVGEIRRKIAGFSLDQRWIRAGSALRIERKRARKGRFLIGTAAMKRLGAVPHTGRQGSQGGMVPLPLTMLDKEVKTMPVLEVLALAIVLLELASRIIELILVIKDALLTHRGKERHP